MIIFFVVYAFLLGTAMDIGCTIGTTEAAGGASRAGRPLLNVKSTKTNGADCCRGGKISQEGEAQPATAKPNPHPPESWPCRPELTGSIEKQATGGHYTLHATLGHETVLFFRNIPSGRRVILLLREFVEKFDILFVTSQSNAAITSASDNN